MSDDPPSKEKSKKQKPISVTPHTEVTERETDDGMQTTIKFDGKKSIKVWPKGTKPLFSTAIA